MMNIEDEMFYGDEPNPTNYEERFSFDEVYREPDSVHISSDWDTVMDDFYDDCDYLDFEPPLLDDDF